MNTKNILFLMLFVASICLQNCIFKKPDDSAKNVPSSFIIFEGEIAHRGDRQLHEDWNFETMRETNPEIPFDWLRGGKQSLLNTGIFLFRVEVRQMERSWNYPMTLHFGWWNIPEDPVIRHIAAPGVNLVNLKPPSSGNPWVYELIGKVLTLDSLCMYYGAGPKASTLVNDWDWSRAIAPNTFYTFIKPLENNLDLDGDGNITEEEYPDTEFYVSLTIYTPEDSAYEFLKDRLNDFRSLAVSYSALPTPN